MQSILQHTDKTSSLSTRRCNRNNICAMLIMLQTVDSMSQHLSCTCCDGPDHGIQEMLSSQSKHLLPFKALRLYEETLQAQSDHMTGSRGAVWGVLNTLGRAIRLRPKIRSALLTSRCSSASVAPRRVKISRVSRSASAASPILIFKNEK